MVLSSPKLDDLDPIQLMMDPNGFMVWANAAGDALRRADRAAVGKLLAQALERGRSAGIIPVPGTSSTATRYLQLFLTRWGDERDPASPVRATVGLVRVLGWDVTALAARHSELGEHRRRDPLTGVASRSAFILSLDDHVARRWRADQRVALFLLHLRLAGAEGEFLEGEVHDRSLITLAARLTATLRQGDIIGRTDTDSFAVICHGIPDWVALSVVLDRLRAVALIPVQGSGAEVEATIVIDSVFIDEAMHHDLFGSGLGHMVPWIPSRRPPSIRERNSICAQDAGPEAAADRRALR